MDPARTYTSSDSDSDGGGLAKKRRVRRACDVCRRKKVRCDGPKLREGKRCSPCATFDLQCAYTNAPMKRRLPPGYVEQLEDRVAKLESLLAQPPKHNETPTNDIAHVGGSTMLKSLASAAPGVSSTPVEEDGLDPSDDDEPSSVGTLAEWLQNLQVNPSLPHYLGKSCGGRLVQTAIGFKNDVVADGHSQPLDRISALRARRPEFWQMDPWEAEHLEIVNATSTGRHFSFPEADLMTALIDQYFIRVNRMAPLLHRPTFENEVADGLYLRDPSIASVLLLVCALGAKYVDDPRVRIDEDTTGRSAGWKYFCQVQIVRETLWTMPRLIDIQIYALAIQYLWTSSAPQLCWAIAGLGLRIAQDVGAHRKKTYSKAPSVHDELWKRAFWVSVHVDRELSLNLGRSLAIYDEDFDIELPMECDDEYWTSGNPSLAFKQPAGKPSMVTFFIHYTKLQQIMAFAIRTLFSINKSKALLGFFGDQWEQNIMAQLDSALNKWLDTLPDHLRWDPHREDPLFLEQSARLYSQYYLAQITIHRQFISIAKKKSPLFFPSLAICTNAARACLRVGEIMQRRSDRMYTMILLAMFTSANVLLLNIWGSKHSRITVDPVKEMEDVRKAMDIIKHSEKRNHAAGRLWDILYEITSGGSPLPQGNPIPAPMKRGRDESDDPARTGVSTHHFSRAAPAMPPEPRAHAPSVHDSDPSFPLPPSHDLAEPQLYPFGTDGEGFQWHPPPNFASVPIPSSEQQYQRASPPVPLPGARTHNMCAMPYTGELPHSSMRQTFLEDSPSDGAHLPGLEAGHGQSVEQVPALSAVTLRPNTLLATALGMDGWQSYVLALNGISEYHGSSHGRATHL